MGIEQGRRTMSVLNKAGKFSVSLASSPQGEGIVLVSNSNGEGIGAIECDEGEGRITLMDKNLKLGWIQRGGK
jgi:hypothetical protein